MEKVITEHQDLLTVEFDGDFVTIYQENPDDDSDIVIVQQKDLRALIAALEEAAKEIGV